MFREKVKNVFCVIRIPKFFFRFIYVIFCPSLTKAVPPAVRPTSPAREPSCSSHLASSTVTPSTAPGPQHSRNLPPQHSSPAIVFHPWTSIRPSIPLLLVFFFFSCYSPGRRGFFFLVIKMPPGFNSFCLSRACLGLPHGSNTFDSHNRIDTLWLNKGSIKPLFNREVSIQQQNAFIEPYLPTRSLSSTQMLLLTLYLTKRSQSSTKMLLLSLYLTTRSLSSTKILSLTVSIQHQKVFIDRLFNREVSIQHKNAFIDPLFNHKVSIQHQNAIIEPLFNHKVSMKHPN